MAEIVQRLNYLQEMYERDPSSTAAADLCVNILSVSAYLWPSTIPETTLIKLWTFVVDETLKQLQPCDSPSREGNHCELSRSLGNEVDNQILRIIDTFISQCPELPFHLFWKKCASAMVRMSSQDDTESALYKMHRCRQLIYGLLHLMTSKLERNDILPLFGIEESFPERFYVLLRLTMKPNENYAAMLEKMELEWNSQRVRFSFQMIASLVQTDSAFELNIIEPAQDLLEDLWSMDEEECNGCLSALLDQILRFYLDKGQKHLEKNSTDVLLKLFSKQDFARRFLECSILCADLHKTTANDTIIKCCLLKAVDERSDMVSVRLQCLSLVGRLQSRIWSMKDSKTLMHVWTADTIRSLFTLILHDSSVRVRRLAVQICTHLSASNILNMEEFTKVCLMKARDQDDKVRLVAIQILSSLPVKLLADCLTEEDWKVIWMRGLHEEKDEARKLAEALILDYVTTDTLAEFPSTRLQFLGLMDCGSSSEQCSSFIYDNVDAIFDKELEYLDHNCTQPDN